MFSGFLVSGFLGFLVSVFLGFLGFWFFLGFLGFWFSWVFWVSGFLGFWVSGFLGVWVCGFVVVVVVVIDAGTAVGGSTACSPARNTASQT